MNTAPWWLLPSMLSNPEQVKHGKELKSALLPTVMKIYCLGVINRF
jgi:hypothetical protein